MSIIYAEGRQRSSNNCLLFERLNEIFYSRCLVYPFRSSNSLANMKEDKKVAIIGGGAAGCGTCLALAENGWKVSLFEKSTIFSGTSGMTPGRLHLGFHFRDLETSLMLMRATIRFVKTFPGHRIGEHLPSLHRLRRGRFFISKDSLVSAGEIFEVDLDKSCNHLYVMWNVKYIFFVFTDLQMPQASLF